MKLSLATALLLGYARAVTSGEASGLSSYSMADAYLDTDRFIGADGDPIILAQTEGHARLVLNKVKKTTEPVELELVQLDECKASEQAAGFDEVTHCPINGKGEKVEAHIKQVNLEDNAYVSDMYVGNPPQKVRGLFDTGSTNTWVLNKKVKLPGNAEKQFSYDDTQSKTKKEVSNKTIGIKFGSGALMGHFISDDVRLGTCDGTTSSGQIHIKNQRFGNVEKQKTIFRGNNFEAVVGLAYPALARKGMKPIFDEMIDQGLLKHNVFAFYLTTKQADGMGIQSDLTFGYYDKAKYKGDMVWHPIKFKYMFGVQLDDLKVNGKPMGLCKNRPQGCLITFDSGTSLMSVPGFAAKELVKQKIPMANFVRPCESQEQFGELTLVINGVDYTLSNEEWMFPSKSIQFAQGGQKMNFNFGPLGPQLMAEVDWDEETIPNPQTEVLLDAELSRKHKASETQACSSTILTMNIAKEMFLVGDVFMRKFYTVFDRENDRVGLAEAVTNDKVKALSSK